MSDVILVNYSELKTRYGITFTRVGLNRIIRRGDFPAPIKVGGRRIAWRARDIDEWIDTREPAREVVVSE